MRDIINKHFIGDDKDEAVNLYERYLLAKTRDITTFGKNFYTPNIWDWFQKNLSTKYFKVETYGIFEDSERRMVCFNNNFNNQFPMKLIKIRNTSKFSSITHRDYLGGLLALGIERNKIGDLFVDNDICYVAVCEEIESYITTNLQKISNVNCSTEVLDNFTLLPKAKFKEEIILVSSLRIDGVVSKITNLSRSKIDNFIDQGQVLVNYVKIKNKSFELKDKDKITIRGFGKYILGETIGKSKSGKIKIIVKKYI